MLLSWVDGPTADTVLEAVAHGLPTPDRIEIRRSFLFERAMPVALERLAQDISCSSDAVARRLEATALDSSAADGRFARRTALLRGAGDAGNWELGQPLVLAEAAAVTYDIATLFAPYGNEILEVYLALVGDLGSWIPGRADRRLLDLATLALGEGVAGRRGASRAGGGRAGRKMTPDPVGARRRRPESA